MIILFVVVDLQRSRTHNLTQLLHLGEGYGYFTTSAGTQNNFQTLYDQPVHRSVHSHPTCGQRDVLYCGSIVLFIAGQASQATLRFGAASVHESK